MAFRIPFAAFLACALFLAAGQVMAQGVPIAAGGLDLSTSVDNPAPGVPVTITARSYSIDINSASVTWTVNGKAVQQGNGLTTYKVTAPALGKKLIVQVSATTPSGSTVSGSITISSGSVDMIVETDGYTPPFFMGKVPVAYQNKVTIIAVPHIANSSGVEYDPKTLVYQWKRNGQAIEDQSGYGQQALSIIGDIVPRGFTITLDVSTRDGTAQASGYLNISYASPSIGLYVDDPLYGTLFNRDISDQFQIGNEREVGILAAPFGFNSFAKDFSNYKVTWQVNGTTHPELAANRSVILRAPDDGSSGSTNVQLSLQNVKKILQGAARAFSVSFSSSASSTAAY